MRDLNWNDLRYVLAVARTASFSSAARTLGVNESTVARRVAQAEQQLGVRLFERSPGILSLTKSGQVVIEYVERVELDIRALENAVSGADKLAAGSVRITSVPIVINHILVPALSNLLDEQPQLQVELIAEPRNLSLMKREADLAVRLARPSEEMRIVARRIGQLDYAVFGRSGLCMKSLPWITYEDYMADLPPARWIADRNTHAENTQTQILVNDAEAILECIKAGLGKSILPVAIAEQEPGLVRLEDDLVPMSREVWLMVHPELRELARVRIVMNWLISLFGQLQLANAMEFS